MSLLGNTAICCQYNNIQYMFLSHMHRNTNSTTFNAGEYLLLLLLFLRILSSLQSKVRVAAKLTYQNHCLHRYSQGASTSKEIGMAAVERRGPITHLQFFTTSS